jgi:hypothetical protein
MTAHTTFAASSLAISGEFSNPAPITVNQHRRSVMMLCAVILAPMLLVGIYGANYYVLSQADRPFSPKHHLLKPSGAVGINMGILGVLMLCAIFVYPLRKRWTWLRRRGDSRHWLDYHVVLGVAAPVFIAFHSSFKFRGLAGIAFWVMVGIAVSGLVGRYLYGLIIREVAQAELSLKEYRQILAEQNTVAQSHLRPLMHVPAADEAARWSIFRAIGYVLVSDLLRPFRIAQVRTQHLELRQIVTSVGGLRPTKHLLLEWVVALASKQAALSNRIVFLAQLQQVFRLWHVIHRPFSYAFAVLALAHIFVAMLMGFI